MKLSFGRLPVLAKISALSFGTPLVAYGVTLMAGDVNDILQAHSLYSGPHLGLAVGPIFALVGASFLWPMRPFLG